MLIKSKAINHGICCDSCQEDVNVHGCAKCRANFMDGDTVYCKHHSHSDCEHYHEHCKPEEKEDG